MSDEAATGRVPTTSALDLVSVVTDFGEGPLGSTAGAPVAWFGDRLVMAGFVPGGGTGLFTLDLADRTWEVVFEGGVSAAPAAMATVLGQGDHPPSLFCWVPSGHDGVLLRSSDGQDFVPVAKDTAPASLDLLTPLDDRLCAASAATGAAIWQSADPASGVWTRLDGPGLGETEMRASALAEAQGHLHVGLADPQRGFQLWRRGVSDADAQTWHDILDRGAWRYSSNPAVTHMASFRGDLYVGTGLLQSQDPIPPSAELLRLRADGTWDLLVGEPRFSPHGLKIPLSTLGPGFDSPFNSAISHLVVHRDVLYAASRNWEPDYRASRPGEAIQGGDQLWASKDGRAWSRVLPDELGLLGIRALCSTPQGLVVAVSDRSEPDRPEEGATPSFGAADGQVVEALAILLIDDRALEL